MHLLNDNFAKNKRGEDERISYISAGPVPDAVHSVTLKEAELTQPQEPCRDRRVGIAMGAELSAWSLQGMCPERASQ